MPLPEFGEVEELAYHELISQHLPKHEYLGELVRDKLVYFPTVTREDFHTRGRITELIESGELFERLNVPAFSTENDRIMLCGSPDMLKEVRLTLEARAFMEGNMSEPGHFVLEKAFVG